MTAESPSLTGPRALTEGEQAAVAVTTGAVGVLGLLGFVNSFDGVADAAAPTFGALAWTVPLGIDLGIAVFSALDIVLARLDMRVRWLRFIPWALTGATIYLNISPYLDTPTGVNWFGIVSHALLPMLWVVAVEVGAHVLRKRAGLANPERMERIRASRWLLATPSTFALWRRMVLWEVRSYPVALEREKERVLARTDLQDRYGRLWRFKATRRERALYRLGELAPADAPIHTPADAAALHVETVRLDPPAPVSADADRPALPPAPRKRTAVPAASTGRRTATKRTAPPDVDDLMPIGRTVAADLTAQGLTVTRDRLIAAIRASGQSISTDRAAALLARLRTDDPEHTDETRSDRTSSQIRPVRDAAPSRQTEAAPRNPAPINGNEVTSS
ncbi:DUF2637 domain-containing protein [Planomonospora sp. ID82291]|uniref:DUF2637 domain-containing protein n=1 Tax=Planomonospora sp. ID82291 TaxID=2738136 RepID=UPI0018C3CBE2|nr:DUF2637 domain-containing protein [Planomonospora sp. ID82291]MBG0814171.1 DUF2637 domain-containing protein [Planomonospora sp. ID82291]